MIDIKKGEITYLSLPITVGSNKKLSRTVNWNFKIANADTALDLNPIKKDNTVAFVYNKYNADGILIGEETTIGTTGKKYQFPLRMTMCLFQF